MNCPSLQQDAYVQDETVLSLAVALDPSHIHVNSVSGRFARLRFSTLVVVSGASDHSLRLYSKTPCAPRWNTEFGPSVQTKWCIQSNPVL